MPVDFFDTKPIVVQVIEAGVGEFGIEAAKLGEIERIVVTVVETREEAHQAPRLAGGRVLFDGFLDNRKRRRGSEFDRGQVAIERVHSRTFTGDDLSHCAIEYVAPTHWDVGFHVNGLGEGRQLGDVCSWGRVLEFANRHLSCLVG